MTHRPGKRAISAVVFVLALVIISLLVITRPTAHPDQLVQSNSTAAEPPAPPLAPRLSAPAGVGNNTETADADASIPPDEQPIVGKAVQFDVSKPLRDIPVPPVVMATTIREMTEPADTGEEEDKAPAKPLPPAEDPVVQRSFGASANQPAAPNMSAPLVNFEGVNNIDGVYPPDTNGDVSPLYYVQMVNLHMQVFNKSGASVYGPIAANLIWSGFGGSCQTRNDGDPVVLYDALADRWVVSQFTAANPYGECVAVSVTNDPTGAYYRYFFQFSTTIFYDYPRLGVWPDGYYLTANRFNGAAYSGASAIALDRSKMLNGQAAGYQEFLTTTSYGTLLPGDHDGSLTPPADTPAFFAEVNLTALHLWKFHVDWTTPANSTFTGPTTLSIAAWTQLCAGTRNCVPQPGTAIGLDGLGDRLMNRLVYRNMGSYETLLLNHTANVGGGQAGVRWYEVRSPNGTPSIYQQGSYAPDATNRWVGSIAMDGAGDIALGYSVSSGTVYPGIRYTGRLVTDTLGTLPQGEGIIMTGAGSQTGTAYRWGDYANMAIDPMDDCTFWFTTEYISTTGTAPWQTRVGSFKFPSCTPQLQTVLNVTGKSTSDAAGGNNNSVAEPGENIQLRLGLNNVGNLTGTTVSGIVAVANGNAFMQNNASPYNDIAPAAVVTNTTPYTVAISPNQTCGQPITLALTASYNLTYTLNYTFQLPIGALAAPQLLENFDSVTAPALPTGWASAITGSGSGWTTSATTSDSAPNNAVATDPAAVGESDLTTTVFTPTSSSVVITFRNNYNLETGFDGSVLEIKIGASGVFTDILSAGGSFSSGGYVSTLPTTYANPLGGRSAWTGSSGGYITTTIQLPASVAGQPVQLRWRLGSDNSVAGTNQRIDTIYMRDGYVCAAYLAPHTYVDPAGVCFGNAPCYTSPQAALNGTASNGIMTIFSTHNVAAFLTSGSSGANNVTIDGTGTLNWTGGVGPLFSIGNGNLTVKGITLTTSSTVFSQTGSGALVAYANNISGYTTAYVGAGTPNIGHNYWGTNDPSAAAPSGISPADWARRLGASRGGWAEGSGAATLISATLSGGSGTAVIVSHGRGAANAPFGNGIAPYVNQMCSDFYDFFTIGGSGSWTVQIPVDNTSNCNANTLAFKRAAWITDLTQCTPTTNPACWSAYPAANITTNGQNLLLNGVTTAQLGGTPFVAGSTTGTDPTAVTLEHVIAREEGTVNFAPALLVLAAALGAGFLARRHLGRNARL
jgi:hypothetical protein